MNRDFARLNSLDDQLDQALYRQPKLLLLDESMSAMDRNTEAFVLQLLEKDKAKRMTVLVTHRMATAKQCDRIYVLEQGRVTAAGNSVELLAYPNFFSDNVVPV